MEDIEAVKLRLESKNIQQKIAALSQLIKYGQEGLDLVIQALEDESWVLQHTAFLLLRQKPVRRIPQVKKALRKYTIVDGQYPDERQEIKKFLSNFPCSVTDESGNIFPNPALLPLMKWGEVIVDETHAGRYRNEGLYSYIVDSNCGQKVWSEISSVDDGHTIEIDIKFLQKKGYSYYLKDLTFLLECEYYAYLRFPTFNQKESLVFYSYHRLATQDNEEKNRTEFIEFHRNSNFPENSIGEVIEEKGNWFLVSSDGSMKKLPKAKNFYQIPKKYLRLRGYSYYLEISQAHQLPIIGYLSPKEYLDFLNVQILDFLSLKPIWSCL